MEFTSRQQNIIDVSMKIITDEGIENLTTKNIAGQMALSEAALYRHFESKAAILLGILEYFEEKTKKLLDESLKADLSGLNKIRLVLKTRSNGFIENPATMVVVLSEELFPKASKLSEKVHEIMLLNRKVLMQMIEEGQTSGEIRKDLEKEMLFYIIIGPFRFMVTRWRLSQFGFDLDEEFDQYWLAIERLLKTDR